MKHTGHRPTLSIVTIHLNRLDGLKRTASSVWSQDKRGRVWEWLIIDGYSNKECRDWLKRNRKKMDRILISKDRGIYDAMNKGATLARGKWVLFLNAGDVLRDASVLQKILPKLEKSEDAVVFGHARIDYPNGDTRIHRADDQFQIESGMPSSHQSIFARRDWLLRIPFDIEEKIAGDFGFLCRAHNEGATFRAVNLVIAGSEAGGISDTKRLTSIRAHWRLALKFSKKGRTAIHMRYAISYTYTMWMILIRWIVPESVFLKLRVLYWKLCGGKS